MNIQNYANRKRQRALDNFTYKLQNGIFLYKEMHMFKLLQLSISGVKNLENEIRISFCNLVLEKGVKNINNIKAIYGYNGAGKSAIIEAANLYKCLSIQPDYLLDSNNKKRLSRLVNSKSGQIYLSMTFLFDQHNIFKHEFLLKKDQIRQSFYIEEETISKQKGRSLDDEYSPILSKSKDTIFLSSRYKEAMPTYLNNESLRYSSFTSLAYAEANKEGHAISELEKLLLLSFLSASKMEIYLSNEDLNDHFFSEMDKFSAISSLLSNEEIKGQLEEKEVSFASNLIKKEDLSLYEKFNRQLEKFISLFKPSLKKIDLIYQEDRGFYRLRRNFVYEDYSVDFEYESAGIKQLVHLFPYLYASSNGKTVFIDEIDANINSVYLEKMVSFFKLYGKGQLVFTTHNLNAMNALKDQKKSILVLGDEGNIDTWVAKGNRSPISDYCSGNLANSPMNIEDFDFVNIFQGEE